MADVPEWFAALACVIMWAMGFLTCGAIIGNTPFWDGVRSAWTFGSKRRRPLPHKEPEK